MTIATIILKITVIVTVINGRYNDESCMTMIHTIIQHYIVTLVPQAINNGRYFQPCT